MMTLIQWIRRNPGRTSKELMKLTGRTQSSVSGGVSQLVSQGKVYRMDNRYYINEVEQQHVVAAFTDQLGNNITVNITQCVIENTGLQWFFCPCSECGLIVLNTCLDDLNRCRLCREGA